MKYKKIAKQRLNDNWGIAIGAIIITIIINIVLTKVVNVFFPLVLDEVIYSNEVYNQILPRSPILVLVGIIAYPINIGVTRLFYRIINKLDFSINDIFIYYKIRIWDAIKTVLLVNIFKFLWSLLFLIPGIIKSYSYSMTYYIFVDEEFESDGLKAITLSREMMNGKKFKLFILHLSFLGWFLLGIVTLGLAFLYVTPYIKAATSAFYLDVKDYFISKNGDKHELLEENVELLVE